MNERLKWIKLTGRILENLILPGNQCVMGGYVPLTAETWLLNTAWEVLTLCLALWSAVKQFRELRQPWTRWTAGGCFTVLIKSHVLYFARLAHILNGVIFRRWSCVCASFLVVSCFQIGYLSPAIMVRRSVTDLRVTTELTFIIFIGLNYRGHWDLWRCSPNFFARTDVYTGTAPHNRCSNISC